jgi:hypothetical protein
MAKHCRPGAIGPTYLDGCLKYNGTQAWTIHAYADGTLAAWWLVSETSATQIVMPPGTSGFYTRSGAYTTFDECVATNKNVAPVGFNFAGGKIGAWLLDDNYVT